MLAIVFGLLFTVLFAVGIMVMVALPHVRQGSPILSPQGERAMTKAKQQARQAPVAAAGGTWHGLVGLRRSVGRARRRMGTVWAPVSAALHDAFDQLETRSPRDGSARQTPIRHAAGHGSLDRVDTAGPAASAGPAGSVASAASVTPEAAVSPRPASAPGVGRPRGVPAVSGPIPGVHVSGGRQSLRARAVGRAKRPAHATGRTERVIDLRESDPPPEPTTTVRHMR